MIKNISLVSLIILASTTFGQTGVIKGRISESGGGKVVEFATVVLEGTTTGAQSDLDGNYIIENLKPGTYNIAISAIGFKPKTMFEVGVTNSKPAVVDIELETSTLNLEEVVVKANPFQRKEESPISVRSLGLDEIQRAPGANQDISKVVQSIPGVGFSTGFRNDIFIRGGSASENRFYMDDIEIPNINHFSTQGSSGGPIGMINVDFIRDVNFYSSAFPANRGNMLSSNMDIRLREGRDDRWGGSLRLGSSEAYATMESPLNKKKTATILASFRFSYLQLLFKAFDLAFLPTYSDQQLKIKWRPTQKDELTILGLSSADYFKLNLDANETESQRYQLAILPQYNQWSYMLGAKYNHYFENNSYLQVVLSRNALINKFFKYQDNDKSKPKTSDYSSTESENKLRIEYTGRKNGWKYNVGIGYELARYYNRSDFSTPLGPVNFETKIFIHKFAAFSQVSKAFFKERWALSFGLRLDGNSFNNSMANVANQASPRISSSVSIIEGLRWNFNTGYYHQMPAYTSLGYRDNTGQLANKNTLTYMRNVHVVTGFDYATKWNGRFSVEGFYKQYFNVPFSVKEQVSLANLGAGFGVLGNEAVTSTSKGRAYGAEFLYEQKLFKGFYGSLAYTLFWSEYTDGSGRYRPSSWDARHIIAFSLGKKFKKGWELGGRIRAQGGTPYTPFDLPTSSLINVYNAQPSGVLDYSRLNEERLKFFYALDIRVTKKFSFKQWGLELYLDLQNATLARPDQPGNFALNFAPDGSAQIDPNDPSRYITQILRDDRKLGQLLPTLGIVITY
jgi:hypothetical protein